uniref:Arrestin C-terminal-like domain-containing protein n=1 Tax=Astyanax mexicanus TaxID=7994 RepID=A0A3B1JJW0_ASTMX
MSGTIKEFNLNYDAVNQQNTFSSGDLLQGRVILELAKEANISSLYIKFKGDADVRWSERRNDRNHTYHSHERYFKIKQVFIQDPSKPDSNVVRPGRHVYPFSFQLPHGNMPPSFKGFYGSIKYTLEVSLDRSWKMARTATAEINFLPKFAAGGPLLNPQSGGIDKKMTLFTSGSASLNATIDRMGYVLGDTIKVSTNINNSSSRELKLKYSLEQRQTFLAQGRSKHSSKTIFKVVGDPIPTGTKQVVNTDLKLPANMELTINCGIIKLEYVLKVYLDVPYASDPEIKFPVIISGGQFLAPWPNSQPYGPSPPPQHAFGPGLPPQPAFGPGPQPQPGFGPGPQPQPGFGPGPQPQPGFGPVLNLSLDLARSSTSAWIWPGPQPQPGFGPVLNLSLDLGPVLNLSLDLGPVLNLSLDLGPVLNLSLHLGLVLNLSLDLGPVLNLSLHLGLVLNPSLDLGPVLNLSLHLGPVLNPSLDLGPVLNLSLDLGPVPLVLPLDHHQHFTPICTLHLHIHSQPIQELLLLLIQTSTQIKTQQFQDLSNQLESSILHQLLLHTQQWII